MSSIFISISEPVATRLLVAAQEQEISVSTLLERLSLTLTQKEVSGPEKSTFGSVSSSRWIEIAIDRAKAYEKGQTFTLWDLLAEEWDQLPERRVLGRMVSVKFREEGIAERFGDEDVEGVTRMARYKRI